MAVKRLLANKWKSLHCPQLVSWPCAAAPHLGPKGAQTSHGLHLRLASLAKATCRLPQGKSKLVSTKLRLGSEIIVTPQLSDLWARIGRMTRASVLRAVTSQNPTADSRRLYEGLSFSCIFQR